MNLNFIILHLWGGRCPALPFRQKCMYNQVHPQKPCACRGAKTQGQELTGLACGRAQRPGPVRAIATRLSLHSPLALREHWPSLSVRLNPGMQPRTPRPGVLQSPEEPRSPAHPGAEPRGDPRARPVLCGRGQRVSPRGGRWWPRRVSGRIWVGLNREWLDGVD